MRKNFTSVFGFLVRSERVQSSSVYHSTGKNLESQKQAARDAAVSGINSAIIVHYSSPSQINTVPRNKLILYWLSLFSVFRCVH